MPPKSTKEKQNIQIAKEKAFEYQLDLLKMEIQIIDKAIARIDEIAQTTKNWSILIWTGSISIIIGQSDLRQYVIFSAVIPILFVLIDTRWRWVLRNFTFRERKIAEYINSPRLIEAFKKQSFSDFYILDPLGQSFQNTEEYKKRVNFWTTISYLEVYGIYLGMFLISITAGIFFLLNP